MVVSMTLLEPRWMLWWRCMDCGEALFRHDTNYTRRHGRVCPQASKDFPAKVGFDREWRRHIWHQQQLVEHNCDCADESLVGLRVVA